MARSPFFVPCDYSRYLHNTATCIHSQHSPIKTGWSIYHGAYVLLHQPECKCFIPFLGIFEVSCYFAKDFCEESVLELCLSILAYIIQLNNNIFWLKLSASTVSWVFLSIISSFLPSSGWLIYYSILQNLPVYPQNFPHRVPSWDSNH